MTSHLIPQGTRGGKYSSSHCPLQVEAEKGEEEAEEKEEDRSGDLLLDLNSSGVCVCVCVCEPKGEEMYIDPYVLLSCQPTCTILILIHATNLEGTLYSVDPGTRTPKDLQQLRETEMQVPAKTHSYNMYTYIITLSMQVSFAQLEDIFCRQVILFTTFPLWSIVRHSCTCTSFPRPLQLHYWRLPKCT